MEALERSLRALGVESAGRDFSRCKIVEKRARHRRFSDSALVSANQNDRRSCHLPPLCRGAYIRSEMKVNSWRNTNEDVRQWTFLQSASACGAVSAYAQLPHATICYGEPHEGEDF